MIIAYHSAALRELSEIAHYYEQRLPNLGSDFLDELDSVLSVVLENPHIGVSLQHTVSPHFVTTISVCCFLSRQQ